MVDDFYKHIGLIIYMVMLKLDHIADYWRQGHLFSLPLPEKSWHRYRVISWKLHLPDEDVQKDQIGAQCTMTDYSG